MMECACACVLKNEFFDFSKMVSAQQEILELAFGYFFLSVFTLFVAVIALSWSYIRSSKSTPIYKHGVWGGCIEGHYGSRYARKHWLCTATALDVVNARSPIRSVVDDRQLYNLNDISEAHEKNPDVGPLKEFVIKNFPLHYLDDQCKIIIYYMTFIVQSGERFHVHVHRGTRMGQKHIDELKSRLIAVGFQCPSEKSLTFGFGYALDQLGPGTTAKPEYYYSISLFVGFDPRLESGTTFIPTNFVHFENAPRLIKNAFFAVENHLSQTWYVGESCKEQEIFQTKTFH